MLIIISDHPNGTKRIQEITNKQFSLDKLLGDLKNPACTISQIEFRRLTLDQDQMKKLLDCLKNHNRTVRAILFNDHTRQNMKKGLTLNPEGIVEIPVAIKKEIGFIPSEMPQTEKKFDPCVIAEKLSHNRNARLETIIINGANTKSIELRWNQLINRLQSRHIKMSTITADDKIYVHLLCIETITNELRESLPSERSFFVAAITEHMNQLVALISDNRGLMHLISITHHITRCFEQLNIATLSYDYQLRTLRLATALHPSFFSSETQLNHFLTEMTKDTPPEITSQWEQALKCLWIFKENFGPAYEKFAAYWTASLRMVTERTENITKDALLAFMQVDQKNQHDLLFFKSALEVLEEKTDAIEISNTRVLRAMLRLMLTLELEMPAHRNHFTKKKLQAIFDLVFNPDSVDVAEIFLHIAEFAIDLHKQNKLPDSCLNHFLNDTTQQQWFETKLKQLHLSLEAPKLNYLLQVKITEQQEEIDRLKKQLSGLQAKQTSSSSMTLFKTTQIAQTTQTETKSRAINPWKINK